ncbi:MAG: hypothetical protein KDJ97_35175 [Anaerolineae bacterium]|nr:hypothetical protein [Anaerolineae bacterium]
MNRCPNCDGNNFEVIHEYRRDLNDNPSHNGAVDVIIAESDYEDISDMPEEVYEELFVTAWRETGNWDDYNEEIDWTDKDKLELDEVSEDTVTVHCQNCNREIGSRELTQDFRLATASSAISSVVKMILTESAVSES